MAIVRTIECPNGVTVRFDDTYLPRDDRERKERQAELWTTSLTIAANHEAEFEELLAKRRRQREGK